MRLPSTRIIGDPVLQRAIIASKLTPPRAPAALIERTNIARLLEGAGSKRLLLVTAPAGYGKTTFLMQLRQDYLRQGRKVAWLTLDEGDSPLSQFITYLIESLTYAGCPIGHAALTVFQKSAANDVEAFRNALINEIHAYALPLVIIIDDLHYVRSEGIPALLDQLIDYAPTNLGIVIASRHTSPLSTARYRIHGDVVEIKAEDLQLSYQETHQLIQHALATPQAPPDDVSLSRHLHEVTRGWVAAIQLAVISVKNGVPPGKVFSTFSGGMEDLTDFLYTNILAGLPDEIAEFLLKTSILQRINVELCEAVTGLPDCPQLLDAVRQLNLFLLPVEGMETWYIYHPLFREFLQMNLPGLPEVNARELHRRASTWYENQRLFADALHHALAGEDADSALRLFEKSAVRMLGEGRFHTVIQWCETLKPPSIAAYPDIWIATAYSLMLCFRLAEARRIMRRIQRSRLADDALTQFRLSVIELTIAMYQDDGEKILSFYAQWPEALPFQDALFVPAALNPISMVFSQQGEFEQARDIYHYSVGIPDEEKSFMATTYQQCYLAHAYALEGRLKMAERLLRDRLTLSERRLGYFSEAACAAAGFLAEILYETNRLEELCATLAERMAIIRDNLTPDGIIKPHVAMAMAYVSYGEHEQALSCVEELYALGRRTEQRRFIITALGVRAFIYLQMADPTSAAAATGQAGDMVKRIDPQAVLAKEFYIIHALAEIRLLIYRQDYQAALDRLTTLKARYVNPRQRRLALQVAALIYLCMVRLRPEDDISESLYKVLLEGRAMGLVRLFLDEAPLLGQLREVAGAFTADRRFNDVHGYLAALLKLGGELETTPPCLTARETEILIALAAGLSNKHIASRQHVSVDTIKYHVKKIYAKIKVSKRMDAALYARKAGLVSGASSTSPTLEFP